MMKQDNSAEFLDAPHSEPQRQYYFIEKGHAFVDALRTELARPVTFAVTTFGCQMNARDSEKLTGILLALGYEPAESEDADFVILNTCTVRDNANMRVYGRLGILGGLKKKRPHMKIALCGCMMQDAAVVEKIRKSYRFVNLIFGTQNLYQFAELFVRMWGENKIVSVNFLNRNPNVTNSNIASTNNDNVFSNTDAILSSMDGIPPHTDVVSSKTDITSSKMLINPSERCAASAAFDHDDPPIVENLPTKRKHPFKTGINIMYGCDNFCTYCIVPYVRGRERSRDPKEILAEIRAAAAGGVVEVMLLGQNVNSYAPKAYGSDMTFAQLLWEVTKIEPIRRIRFMTSHPKDLSDELIDVMCVSPKICRQLHLPLQSGSTRILEAMNRRYTKEMYLDLAQRVRDRIPGIALSTDLMVGFPGETPADVDETIDVVRRVCFENAFTFIYSPRSQTPAAALPQSDPQQVKQDFARLLEVVQEVARERAHLLEGEVQEVLVEEINAQNPTLYTGRLSNNMPVHFPKPDDTGALIGSFLPIRLDQSCGFYFMGSIV